MKWATGLKRATDISSRGFNASNNELQVDYVRFSYRRANDKKSTFDWQIKCSYEVRAKVDE